MKIKTLVVALALLPTFAFAQGATHMASKHDHMMMMCKMNDAPFIKDFDKQMATMHKDMTAFEKAKGQDEAFILGMIPHHQGAIEMAKTLKKYSQDKELLAMADDIIKSQSAEIETMKQLLKGVKADKDVKSLAAAKAEYTQENNKMHADMMRYCDHKNIDASFMAGMIPHHQGAIEMAKTYLKYGKNEKLKTICNDIIAAQTKEIKFMTDKLAATPMPLAAGPEVGHEAAPAKAAK